MNMSTKDEMNKIISQGGKYIPPHKLQEMSKTANRVIKLLTDNVNAVSFSYEDIDMILDMVHYTLGKARTEQTYEH